MLVPKQSHGNGGAPEISDGAHYTVPRSWKNLMKWSERTDRPNFVQEKTRSNTGSTRETPTDNYNEFDRHRHRHPVAVIGLKHAIIFLAFSIPIIFLALVIKIPKWYNFQSDYWLSKSFTHCNFNGQFTPSNKPTISLWNPSGFFYITVAWGKMAFSTAKFIDIVWDIAIGRGGQALLAFVTFKVSSQYLALAMREAPVSYNTYESLAFVSPGLIRTGRLAGDLLTQRGWRARLIVIWIVLSSLFVLSFSSWISAMSGYSSNISAVMPNHDNESVPWSNYLVVQFAINDAERIGQSGPLYITTGEVCVRQGFVDGDDTDGGGSYDIPRPDRNRVRRDTDHDVDDDDDANGNEDGDDGDADENGEVPWNYIPANCTDFWRTVQYVSLYGLDGKNHSESTIILNGTNYTLTGPVLNITTSYSLVAISTLTTYLTTFSESSPPASGALSSVSQLTDNTFWVYENETYPFSYALANASCQYSKWHNWGFSFLFLFVTALLLAIWAVGTYALWLYTYLHSPPDRVTGEDTTGGIYRSSWTLVEAMKRDVGPGAVVPEMGEWEIRDLVRRRRGRILQGVGNIDCTSPTVLAEPEKNLTSSPTTISSTHHFAPTRFNILRAYLSPSTRPRPHVVEGIQTPANSVFTHANSAVSSSSQRPILQSPAAPGRTMTMTSRLSSLASPFTDSPMEFGFSAAEEVDIINGVSNMFPGASNAATTTTTKPRPKLSLSRAIRSSSYTSNRPRAGSLFSPTSTVAGRGPSSPATYSPTDDSNSPISPLQEDRNDPEKDEDAMIWKNDLGDD